MPSLVEELSSIVGPDNVSDEEHVRYVYSLDMTPEEGVLPDYVVLAESVEQVKAVLALANERRVPVTPYVAGTNVGGLALPMKGGIVLDLKKMNRVIEVDEELMVAVVEPGVSFGQLQRELERRGLRYPIPASPHNASVLCNALLEGHGDLAPLTGLQCDNITGMEVVLPTGEVARIGSCSITSSWFTRYAVPDLCGLFIGWQGATGVVTKLGVKVFPKPRFVDLVMFEHFDFKDLTSFVLDVCRARIADVCSSDSWAVRAAREVGLGGKLPAKGEGEGDMYTRVAISGDSLDELEYKRRRLKELSERYRRSIKEVELTEDQKKLYLTLPSKTGWAGFAAYKGGGVTWVGSYCPLRAWPQGIPRLMEVQRSYGLEPMVVVKAIDGGRFGMLRALIPYDRADLDEVRRVKEAMRKLATELLDLGAVIYKPPAWAAELMWRRADPGFLALLSKVKKALDPNGVMNPGRLALP